MTPDTLQAMRQPVPQTKAAEVPLLKDLAQQQLTQELMQQLMGTGLAAVGVGAGARGAVGLYNLARRNLLGSKAKPMGPWRWMSRFR